jgi:hypothetical protein
MYIKGYQMEKSDIEKSCSSDLPHTKEAGSNKVVLNKVFRISDLIGGSRKRVPATPAAATTTCTDKKKRKNRNGTNSTKNIDYEASAFKVSNRLQIQGTKTKKVKEPTKVGTDLLWLHQRKMQQFEDMYEKVLPKKEKELEKLKREEETGGESDKVPRQKRIFQLEKEIEALISREEEMQYVMTTQPIIEKYITMMDNEDETQFQQDTSGSITRFIRKYDNVEKQKVTEEYCRLVNNGLLVNSKSLCFDNTTCAYCGEPTNLVEGFICCTNTHCGFVSEHSVHDFRVSYNDFQDTTVRSTFAYKRINRFNEILSTIQGKENTEIPEYVMNALWKEIQQEKDLDINTIDHDKIRYYLKRLSLPAYYERIPHILNKINGLNPVQFPSEVEEMLREMFKDIQEPYETVKAVICPERQSFLSYNYVFYKFLELLDLEEYQKCFTLLKSVEKLRIQDSIWKGICEILGWEYIPSI